MPPETLHPRYSIRNVTFSSNDNATIHLRPGVLRRSTLIKQGDLFSATQLQRTYGNFARMQAVRYTNIRFYRSARHHFARLRHQYQYQ